MGSTHPTHFWRSSEMSSLIKLLLIKIFHIWLGNIHCTAVKSSLSLCVTCVHLMCVDSVLLPASFGRVLAASPTQIFLLPPSHLFFFLMGSTASSCWRMRHTCRCWTVTHFQPPPACFNTLALCGKNTNTEAVLTWLSQAALEPLKCKLPLRIVPRLLDAKSLFLVYY